MRRAFALIIVAAAVGLLTACAGGATPLPAMTPTTPATRVAAPTASVGVTRPAPTSAPRASATPSHAVTVQPAQDEPAANPATADAATVKLAGDTITLSGKGGMVKGNVLTIISAGVYNISGKLNDGQIVVDTKDDANVTLVFNGMDIANSAGAPIYVANAKKVIVTLAEGTQNSITDGAKYVFPNAETDEPNAALFSKDDLTINGAGALTVKASYNNGIASKDDLKINGGKITVSAVNDGLKGRDSLTVKAGEIKIQAGGDGLQANNAEDPEQGYIVIEGGTFNITAGGDALQAETRLLVSGGEFTIVTGGGSARQAADSAKGLKAGVALNITGGFFDINAADDALHSNERMLIAGGIFQLATADDGIHANTALEIAGGDVRITKSYEGIESNQITINDGSVRLVSSDDGINGPASDAGGAPQSRQGGQTGRPGPGGFESGDAQLFIHGGYVAVDAQGDGIDINGAVEMTGGVVLVNGPTANNNGALDYLSAFKVTGGFLAAAGSAGMAQAPSADSTQYSLIHNFSAIQPAKSLIHIETQDGKTLLTFAPTKTYQSIVVSSPEIQKGLTYVIYSGGRAAGTVSDSLYTDGTYSPGAQVASYTVSSVVTGTAGRGMGGGRGGFGSGR